MNSYLSIDFFYIFSSLMYSFMYLLMHLTTDGPRFSLTISIILPLIINNDNYY